MIRDPSDGTVREKQNSAPAFEASQNTAERDPSVMPDWAGADTDLPDAPEKSDELIRLEKSREWLKAYSGFSTSTE